MYKQCKNFPVFNNYLNIKLARLVFIWSMVFSTLYTNQVWAICSGDVVTTNNVQLLVQASDSYCSVTNNAGIYIGQPAIVLDPGGFISNFINNANLASSGSDSIVMGVGSAISKFINNDVIYSYSLGKYSLKNSGEITELTNLGIFSGAGVASGINNAAGGVITTLNNLQGQDGPLKLTGTLPVNYNIIISSGSSYGKLTSRLSHTSTTAFGISTLSSTSSSILNTPLTSVLSGITASQLGYEGSTSISALSNGYAYTLYLNDPIASSTLWDLTISSYTSADSGSSDTASNTASSTIASGASVSLSSMNGVAFPVFSGGTLVLSNADSSTQSFSILSAGGTITAPSTGSATLSGVFSGSGGLTFNGTGTILFSGINTYSGGTTVASGTLSVAGSSPTGSGAVYVASGASLMGTGTIAGAVTIDGTLKPGHSPGYLATSSRVTMNSGSVYQQDIAGNTQANIATPAGATGYYSALNINSGQFVINSGATLSPRLTNLFNPTESGYGSAPYTPVLGDRFRIVTAEGGVVGKFSKVIQPTELIAGIQFLPFYNMAGSNSLDLAVIPTSYQSTLSTLSGNKNAQSVGGVLDRITLASQSGVSTNAQDQLLYAGSTQNAANLPAYTQSLSGEVYAAAVAVAAQTSQRVQQSVMSRLSDTLGGGLTHSMTGPSGNAALMSASNTVLSGGLANATVSTNTQINPAKESKSLSNPNVWGDLAYQKGNRSSDNHSGGWNSNLYQLVFGSDVLTENGMKVGGGFALSSTTLNPTYGAGTIQQGSLFAYGNLPIAEYVVDTMVSFGLNSSDLSRSDATGLSNGFRNKTISGNDAMVSLGLSRPIELDSARVTPYARVTWQVVTQSGVNEGDVASALSVNRYTGNGLRGVLGVTAGSKENNPMMESFTYRAYIGVGADTSGLLNPAMNATLAGLGTTITTPNAGSTFVQAGLYGTVKVSDHAYAFAGVSGEARSGQTLGVVNVGLKIQF